MHTSGDNVGEILDFRNKATCPNFINFLRKSSNELKDLLLKAIDGQLNELRSVEGEGTIVEKDLKTLKKWAEKVNGDKADKEAVKILKAGGFSIV